MAPPRVSAGDKVISPLVLANDLRLLAKNETIATPFRLPPGLSGFLQGLFDGFRPVRKQLRQRLQDIGSTPELVA